ncbi:phosphoglycerate kinase [Candidatus Azobacteroides pseudotrichonymphae]|jgi:phosphoglycerate kinase|uniref:Phosphoglycerate kinase n=1 Tax=Azobacteroides pseudotrichonymphae genomovar. CFP2 TaxID=511995 RepID=B6YQL1_AZOPC|nr:phosphoglycerate kinase [Candidatus Azobacteroides pseudotrichonymphae]BAG83483.1 phosphoglycerate kinase [Candidatus Azobacteroides pseudotrichonymphae genomovar. CFP2]
MKKIDNFPFVGHKVFVRVDFNVPLDENFTITDDTRIRAAMPTLKKVIADGGSLIIGSHLGRPKGINPKYSLRHILQRVSELLGTKIDFVEDCLGKKASEKAASLQPGQALLLENLRFHASEEGKPRELVDNISEEEKIIAKQIEKNNQRNMARQLASYATVYVNDAFGTAHRSHASTAIMADYFNSEHKLFGYLMQKEISSVEKILKDTVRPFTAIMGGSKVSSKIDIIENLLNKVDNLILTGGMTYTFAKVMGGKIGDSICENDKLELASDLIQKAKDAKVRLVLAVDARIADSFSNEAHTQIVAVDKIPDGWMGLDIGNETEKIFTKIIENSKTILWNGPTGVFEFDNFCKGSRAVGDAIVRATQKGAFSLVGGGDSVSCVNKLKIADKVSYVSTGGGALLEFIEGKQLPGIKAIRGY